MHGNWRRVVKAVSLFPGKFGIVRSLVIRDVEFRVRFGRHAVRLGDRLIRLLRVGFGSHSTEVVVGFGGCLIGFIVAAADRFAAIRFSGRWRRVLGGTIRTLRSPRRRRLCVLRLVGEGDTCAERCCRGKSHPKRDSQSADSANVLGVSRAGCGVGRSPRAI